MSENIQWYVFKPIPFGVKAFRWLANNLKLCGTWNPTINVVDAIQICEEGNLRIGVLSEEEYMVVEILDNFQNFKVVRKIKLPNQTEEPVFCHQTTNATTILQHHFMDGSMYITKVKSMAVTGNTGMICYESTAEHSKYKTNAEIAEDTPRSKIIYESEKLQTLGNIQESENLQNCNSLLNSENDDGLENLPDNNNVQTTANVQNFKALQDSEKIVLDKGSSNNQNVELVEKSIGNKSTNDSANEQTMENEPCIESQENRESNQSSELNQTCKELCALLNSLKGEYQPLDKEKLLCEIKSAMVAFPEKEVLECCLNACFTLPKMQIDYLNDLLEMTIFGQSSISKIQQTKKKFYTLCLITEPNPDGISIATWKEFKKCNLVQACVQFFKKGSIRAVITIWNRHAGECLDIQSKMDQILAELPMEMPTKVFAPWLANVVTRAIAEDDTKLLQQLDSWVMKRINWILSAHNDSALGLQDVVTLIHIVYPGTPMMTKQTQARPLMNNIMDIHTRVKDVLYLTEHHQFELSVDAFSKVDHASIIFAMIDRITDPVVVHDQIQKHIFPYSNFKKLDASQLLIDYIQDTIEDTRLGDKLLEKKIIAVVHCIPGDEQRRFAALCILRGCLLPYSSDIEELIDQLCAEKGKYYEEELQQQIRLMRLQRMLLQYDIAPTVNLTDPFVTRRVLQYMTKQLHHKSIYLDLMQFMNAYSRPSIQPICRLAENIIVNISVELLETQLETLLLVHLKDQAPKILKHIICFCVELLALKKCSAAASIALEVVMARAIKLDSLKLRIRYHELIVDNSFVQRIRIFIRLQSMNVMQGKEVEYLIDPASKLKLFQLALETYYHPNSVGAPQLSKVVHIGGLLGLKSIECYAHFAIHAANCGHASLALEAGKALLQGLATSQKDKLTVCALLAQAAKSLIDCIAKDPTKVGAMAQIPQVALSISECALGAPAQSNENFVESCRNYHKIFIFYQVYANTMVGSKVENFVEVTENTLYPSWYPGDSVVLSNSRVVHLISNLFTAHGESEHEWERQLISAIMQQHANELALQVIFTLPSAKSVVISSEHAKEEKRLLCGAINKQLHLMVEKLLKCSCIDMELILGYFVSLDKKIAFESFRTQIMHETAYKDFERLKQIARIGIAVARIWKEIGFLHHCTDLYENTKWISYFQLLGIPCMHRTLQRENRNTQEIKQIVPLFLEKTNYRIDQVLEFTQYYDIEDHYPCILYARYTFLNVDVVHIRSNLEAILPMIHGQKLIDMLKSILKDQVESFDYPRIRCILELLYSTYERISSTTNEDKVQTRKQIDLVSMLQSFSNALAHSKVNLSFHQLLIDPWDCFKESLTAENVGRLIAFCTPLSLDPDEVYMHVVNSIVENSKGTRKVPFSTFQSILCSVKNADNIALISEWIVDQQCLTADDQVAALSYALETARNNFDQSDIQGSFTDSEVAERLLTKKQRLEISLIMGEIAMDDIDKVNDLVEFADRPDELLAQCYLQLLPLFLKQVHACDTERRKTFHRCMETLSKYTQVSIKKCHLELCGHWLIKDSLPDKLLSKNNDTNVFDATYDEKRSLLDQEYVACLVYICGYYVCEGCETKAVHELLMYLVKYAYDAKANRTYRARYRAITTLIMLNSPLGFKFCQEYTKKPIHMLALHVKYMIVIEEVRFPLTMEQLMDSKKVDVLFGMWRNHQRYDRRILSLMLSMAFDFEVSVSSIWSNLIQKMINQRMIRPILLTMNAIYKSPKHVEIQYLLSSSTFLPYWKTLVTECMTELPYGSAPIPQSTSYILDQWIEFIASSNDMEHYNLPQLVRRIQSLGAGYSSYAMRLILLIPSPSIRAAGIEGLIQAGHSVELLHHVVVGCNIYIDEDEVNDASSIMNFEDGDASVVQRIFTVINENKQIACIDGTVFEAPFMDFLADTGCIENFISYQYVVSLIVNFINYLS